MTKSSRLRNLWEMLEFYASKLIDVMGKVGSLHQSVTDLVRRDSHAGLSMMPDEYLRFKSAIEELGDLLKSMDLPISVFSVNDLIYHMENNKKDGSLVILPGEMPSFNANLQDIFKTVKRELSKKLFLSVEPIKANYYSPENPLFGDDVANSFPSCAYEIDEAA